MCCDSSKRVLRGDDSSYSNKTSVSEGRGFFRFETRPGQKIDRFCCIKIDNGIIKKGSDQRCDYLFVRCVNEEAFFVELKGSDKLNNAYDQVVATIRFTSGKGLFTDYQKRIGILAVRRVAPRSNLDNLKEDFVRQKLGRELKATQVYKI